MRLSRTQALLMLNLGILCLAVILLVIFIRNGDVPASAESTSRRISDFALLDHLGNFHKLSRYGGSRAVVLYVHGVGCPIVRNHLPTLKRLRDHYEAQGITFLLLNCNPQDDRRALQEEAAKYEIDIPILKDDAQLVMDLLEIKRTGETFLLDSRSREIVYHGPVDDSLDYESQKTEASRRYLRDAIESFLAGQEIVAHPGLEVRGCVVSEMGDTADNGHTRTYVDDVASILKDRCVVCHRSGGVAPWAMDSYQNVLGWRAMIREVILSRRMPPRQPDPHYLPLSQIHGISPQEARTIVRWINAGSPRGDGIDPLLTEDLSKDDEFAIDKAEIVIKLPPQTIPATGEIAYRTNALKLDLNREVWVRAGYIQPSVPEVLHHAFCRTSPVSGDKSVPEGYSKRGISEKWRKTNIAAYVPGMSSLELPAETGFRVPKQCALVILYHYTTIGTEVIDNPRLALFLHKKKPLFELKMKVIERRDFRIPPQAQDYRVRDDYIFPQDVLLMGIGPHMHYRGASFRCEAELPNGFKKVIFSLPNYRMTWQGLYWFENPGCDPKGNEA